MALRSRHDQGRAALCAKNAHRADVTRRVRLRQHKDQLRLYVPQMMAPSNIFQHLDQRRTDHWWGRGSAARTNMSLPTVA